MAKWLKVVLWIIGSILLLLLIAWGVLYYYVYINKKPLLERINKEASAKVKGEVIIGDLELAFWRDFPEVNLLLTDISVRDSLYAEHKRALFSADELYVKMNFPSMFSSISEVEKINVVNAQFYLFTDSNGYTNKYLINSEKTEAEVLEKDKREIYVFFINLDNFRLLIEDAPADKKFDAQIHSLKATLINTDTTISISAPIDAQVGQLGFNLEKGAFLIDKKLEATFEIHYHKNNQILQLPLQTIVVEDEPIDLGLLFNFKNNPGTYEVMIVDSSINYEKGLSLISRHINNKLKPIYLSQPVSIYTFVSGHFGRKVKPYVHVGFHTVNNGLTTDFGDVDSASFEGFYDNNYTDGLGYVDSNSYIKVKKITGKFNGNIPFEGDSIQVHNFKRTHLYANVKADFPVASLNELIGNAVHFTKGVASTQLHFDGLINSKIKSQRNLVGYLKVKDGQMLYKPKNMAFKGIDIDLRFTGQDLEIKNIDLYKGRSIMQVNGSAKNFLNAYFENPEKIQINVDIKSPLLDLNDFKVLLATPIKNEKVAERVKKQKMQDLNNRIDQMLTQGNMHLHMKVDKIEMDAFTANTMVADIDLLSNKIVVNKMKVNHAGGFIDLNGYVHQSATNNPFAIKGKIKNVDLDLFLLAFDNFGMQAVTNENIRGKFTSDIDLMGKFTDQGVLLKRSIKGNVDFVLSDAAFINFYPFTEIKKYVFKRRNLDSISFFDIKNNFLVEDGKVIIFPMEIRNNAMNVFIKGIYAFEEGTDLSIEIPLANPKKDNKRVLEGKASKRRGLKVYLRAKDDEDGNVKISWDPFKRGDDEVDAKLYLTEDGELKDEEESTSSDQNIFFTEKYKDMLLQQWNRGDRQERKKNFWGRAYDFYKRTIKDSGKVK